jgi:hypothetical protein
MEAPATAVNETLRRNSLRVNLLFTMFSTRGESGRRFGFQGLEFRFMRVMTLSTEIISPFAGPHKISGSFPVKTCLPILINVPMAFATEAIAFRKIDQISVIEAQLIPIPGIVAIEAPSHRLSVMKLDVGVLFFQDPLLPIQFHGRMAVAAGKHPFRHRRRHIFLNN